MAGGLPHGLQDALRYALRSQNTGLDSGIGSNSFDHCGAFGDALCVLRHCIACHTNEREQQQLLHHSEAPNTPGCAVKPVSLQSVFLRQQDGDDTLCDSWVGRIGGMHG